MDLKKINCLRRKIIEKRRKYNFEKDYYKKRKLWFEIQIEELKIKIEKIK